MRRLVLEFSLNDAVKALKSTESDISEHNDGLQQQDLRRHKMLQKIKLFETIHMLRHDQEEFAAIFKMEPKDPSLNIKELLKTILFDVKGEYHLLEHEKGTYTYFIKGKHQQPSLEPKGERTSMYLTVPFSIRDGKIRATWVGDNEQVKEFLESVGFSYKIVSLMDARFSSSSPVSRLTEKQRNAILLAFRLGYFETPRKINVDELAAKLDLANSTLAVHLRRAERRLLAELLSE
jgi:predicted DNA binding protein